MSHINSKLPVRSHSQDSEVTRSPSCMETLTDRRVVTSRERTLGGVSSIIQGFPFFTRVIAISALPGFQERFAKVLSDLLQQAHMTPPQSLPLMGASQGSWFNIRLRAHVSFPRLSPGSHPAAQTQTRNILLPRQLCFISGQLWLSETNFSQEKKKYIIYPLALVLFPPDPGEQMQFLSVKYKAGVRAPEPAIMYDSGSLFLLTLQFRRHSV